MGSFRVCALGIGTPLFIFMNQESEIVTKGADSFRHINFFEAYKAAIAGFLFGLAAVDRSGTLLVAGAIIAFQGGSEILRRWTTSSDASSLMGD